MDQVDNAVRGLCHLMCPEKEIKEREAKDLVHYFERPLESAKNLRSGANSSLMIKEYCRPAPGRDMLEPSELRPADILIRTVNYLFYNIIPRKDVPWFRVYEFVFDRLRAVRQDMVIQRISGNEAIQILEYCVRFLIYAGYRLCVEPMANFDPEINRVHTLECLKRLMILYDQDNVCHCRQGQFVALYLLYSVDSDDAVFTSLQLKDTLAFGDIFMTSLSLRFAWQRRNFIQVFRLLSHLPFLHFCALHRHLDHFRCLALRVISSAVGTRAQQLPLSRLASWFGCSVADVEVLCTSCGFAVNKDVVSISRQAFHQPQTVQSQICEKVVLSETSSKNLSDWLCGETCTADCPTKIEQSLQQ